VSCKEEKTAEEEVIGTDDENNQTISKPEIKRFLDIFKR